MNQGVAYSFLKLLADESEVNKITIKVKPEIFKKVVKKKNAALIIIARDGLLARKTIYLTYYKGLYFLCKTFKELQLPEDVEIVIAQKIWMY